jgi:hypothetical protein
MSLLENAAPYFRLVTLQVIRIKQMAKFKAWFYSEGMRAPLPVALGR